MLGGCSGYVRHVWIVSEKRVSRRVCGEAAYILSSE